MARESKIGAETKLAIVKELSAGVAVKSIIGRYPGAGSTTIKQIAEEFGIPVRTHRRALTETEDQQIRELHDAGYGAAAIAKQMGLNESTVGHRVRDYKADKKIAAERLTSADEPRPREYLKKLREGIGLTMQQVGDAVGITRQYYDLIEKGKSQKNMDVTLIVKLSQVFGVDIQDIIDREQELAENKPRETEESSETETRDTRNEIRLALAEALTITAEDLRRTAAEDE